MKFYSNQVLELSNRMLNQSILATLIYGPDQGLISYSLNSIIELLKASRRTIDYKETSESELRSILNNINLFGNKEIIVVSGMPPSVNAQFKELLGTQHHHFLILISDELSPSSSLRKLCDQEANLASIACYHDDTVSIEKLVRKYCSDEKKHISSDALKYLSHYLYGDRYIIVNELRKLFTYTINKSDITLDDVVSVISSNTTPEPDMLCIYFFKQDAGNYLVELNKILSENISGVWVVRALIRYAVNIYFTLQKMSDGMSLADAVSSISPPIFFKYLNDFKYIVANINIQAITIVLKKLYHAEISLKSMGQKDKLICESLLWSCRV